jgi:hypothetical protein
LIGLAASGNLVSPQQPPVISTEVAAVLFRVPFLGTRRHAAEKSLSRFSLAPFPFTVEGDGLP